jgi:hypothetical protein
MGNQARRPSQLPPRPRAGHLAPRQDALWGENDDVQPIGQHLANLRKGGLGKDPERAADRAQQLTAIDPDWNCPWPLDWQRHYAILRDLAADEAGGTLPHIPPGVLFEGDDLGKWLQRQARDWAQLSTEQQERLTALGVTPAQRPSPAPAKKSAASAGKASTAFQRGVAALAQYIQREGTHAVGRSHTERIVIDDQEHELKLGVWYSNTKSRRDKLTEPQRTALTELGIDWA